ncbi:MAG: cytochrome c oxidase subunit II, partial [Halobacteria archaeon]|nr:cytochrome c oxidase subunit II [Halobacteria archaeon]
TLLYLESGPEDVAAEDRMDIQVVGFQWGWEFKYPNGYTTTNRLRVPEGEVIRLSVTSRDVSHNFGIRGGDFRRKTDAIPGQTTNMWLVTTNKTGTYTAKCYELCGVGHSSMRAQVNVMPENEFDRWYANTTGESS